MFFVLYKNDFTPSAAQRTSSGNDINKPSTGRRSDMATRYKRDAGIRLLVFAVAAVFSLWHSDAFSSDPDTLFLLTSDGPPGSASFQDISGRGIAITPHGSANHSTATAKFGDTSIQIAGSGNYLSLSQDPLSGIGYGDFTVDLWVYLNGPDGTIIGGYSWALGTGFEIAQIYGQLTVTAMGVMSATITAAALPTGQWVHVAVVRNGAVVTLYVNGAATASAAASGAYASSTSGVYLGAMAWNTALYALNGYIDAVRVTRNALWTGNFIPPTTAAPVAPASWEVSDDNDLVTQAHVRIGTSTGQSDLAVNGQITAREVVVTDAGWADFVFDDNYVLPDLGSVEAYVARHRHLPGIPASSDIAASGISVSEMFRHQMAKIEELTLYIIALEKQQKALQARVRILSSEQSRPNR